MVSSGCSLAAWGNLIQSHHPQNEIHMTIQQFIDWCTKNKIDFNTNMAVRAKDDYLLVKDNIYMDAPYFGNCQEGEKCMSKIAPKDKYGEIDWDNAPPFLILDTRQG